MSVARTVAWVVATAILVSFIAMNWNRAPVNIWPLENGYLHFEWPVGVIALIFFLLGVAPMWLVHRTARWRLKRRIASLENSLRAASASLPADAPAIVDEPSIMEPQGDSAPGDPR